MLRLSLVSIRLICLAALVCASALPQTEPQIVGTVSAARSGAIVPLPKAFVSIRSSSGALLATTRTDASGRYRFTGLPAERMSLTAAKAGFLTQSTAGRLGSTIAVDCAKGCRQTAADFIMAPGAVISGALRNSLGEPLARSVVELTPAASDSPSRRSTDDQGRFRFAGLPAGEYKLIVRGPSRGQTVESFSRTLEIAAGERLEDLSFTLGGLGTQSVSGTLSGVPHGEGYRTWIQLSAVDRSAKPLYADVGADGSFQFDAVPRGRYLAGAGSSEVGQGRRTDYDLEILDVQSDMAGLSLRPIRHALITGVVEHAAGIVPASASVQLTSEDGYGFRWFRAAPAGRKFSLDRMRPGVYRIQPRSEGFYVQGLRNGEKIEPAATIKLGPGENRLTVVLAADLSSVYGLVRDPTGAAALPHARVALQGDRGALDARSDQTGRFEFGQVVPGTYRICAWVDLPDDGLVDETAWERAGCRSRYIPIDSASQIEIDLRAAP